MGKNGALMLDFQVLFQFSTYLIARLINKEKNGTLEQKKDLFDYSIRTGFAYAISNNFELGLELDLEFSNLSAPESIQLDYPTPSQGEYAFTIMEHEQFSTRSVVIMPRMSFTSPSGLLPIGLSHQIGIGVSFTKIIEKEYISIIHPVPSWSGETPITVGYEDRVYNYENKAYKGLTFMYTLNVRTPINKFMMITYGIRYNGSIGFGRPLSEYNSLYSMTAGWCLSKSKKKTQKFTNIFQYRYLICIINYSSGANRKTIPSIFSLMCI